MDIIQLDHVSVNHAGRVIFQDLSWPIGDRDRTGLVGPNGAGKSSLLRLICGEYLPDVGTVVPMRGIRIGYLPQDVKLPAGRLLLEESLSPPRRLAAVEAELARIEAQLGDPAVYGDPDSLTRVLDHQERALGEYERLGGPTHEARVRALLHRFGLDQLDLPTEALSGGQKKLVKLIQLAMEAPDVLLLDEPDNHLDLHAKRGLEEFIRGYAGSVIIVSHDRYLLDEVAQEIVELADGRLTRYKGNYTAYATEREMRRLRQQQLFTAQQKEIARIEAAIKRFEHWASIVVDERHIRQARSRRKMLDRMEANGEIIERVTDPRRMALQFQGGRGSQKALEIVNLTMGFDNDLLFVNLNLLVRHGERVGLIGPNGAGKSVLFKLILGELAPLDGLIKVGPSTRIGYYAQEHQTLATWAGETPVTLVRHLTPIGEGEAVAFLGKFLFSYAQTQQPIRTLSGGERSRLQLAALMLQGPNLLLLDEPTNNLDILSAEVLEQALDQFEGTVLTISHDRYFLDQVVDRVVALEDGALTAFEGGFTDYHAAALLSRATAW